MTIKKENIAVKITIIDLFIFRLFRSQALLFWVIVMLFSKVILPLFQTTKFSNYIMGNVAFASLVLFEVSLALGASVVLYFTWWDSIQGTSMLPAANSLGCVDEGAVPSFTLEDAVRF